MKLDVYKRDGSSAGKKVDLPEQIAGAKPHQHAMYLAVKAQMANMRQGTASTKNRSQARGGGRKPWRQKGRGVARAGTIRSPLWVGGGRVFGPQPRDYSQKISKKVKRLARVSAFADKISNDRITVVEDFTLENPKTKELFGILKALGVESQKVLLLVSDYDANILRAGRNIPNLEIRVATTESTYDLLNCERLLVQQSAVEKIVGAYQA